MQIDENTAVSITILCIIACTIAICVIAGFRSCTKEDINPDGLDSIKAKKEKLTEEVNQLDSVKDVEIEKVKRLDNDSSLMLFYELIRRK